MYFTSNHAIALTGCTKNQLKYWRETGLVEPSMDGTEGESQSREMYSFRDLVELRTIKQMLDQGISLQKIRKTLSYLKENMKLERPLSECKLVTDGSTIFKICASSGEIIDTLRMGQIAFFIAIDRIVEEVERKCSEFLEDRRRFIDNLTGEEPLFTLKDMQSA